MSDVDTDFVDERSGTDCKTGLCGKLVDLGWVDTLLEEAEDFLQSWCQTSIAVEAGDIFDDDNSFFSASDRLQIGRAHV